MQNIFRGTRFQRGVTTVQIMVGLAVMGIVAVGGMQTLKRIEDSKLKNELQELISIRAGLVQWASRKGGVFTGFTLATACNHSFFPASRCSGSGATTAVTNEWGSQVTLALTNLTSTNTGVKMIYPGYSSRGCLQQVLDVWHEAARIDVGSTAVKTTTTQSIDEDTANTACKAATDNATVSYTFGTN